MVWTSSFLEITEILRTDAHDNRYTKKVLDGWKRRPKQYKVHQSLVTMPVLPPTPHPQGRLDIARIMCCVFTFVLSMKCRVTAGGGGVCRNSEDDSSVGSNSRGLNNCLSPQ